MIRAKIMDRVSVVNRSLIAVWLLLLASPLVCQNAPKPLDGSPSKYLRHKVSCLCGTVQICSGDICLSPSTFNLDADITVELRDKAGTTILDSKKVVIAKREKECTTQNGAKVPCNTTERSFCFDGKRDGDYQLAFVLHKDGTPQAPVKFPTNYSSKRRKACNTVYMVEPK